MKFSRTILLISSLISLAMSCQRVERSLPVAEALMEVRPDSALLLLQAIDRPKNLSEADYALYSLLTTQALDKCDSNLIGDTLIDDAVNYYRYLPDSAYGAKAFFYAGRVAEERGYAVRAVDCYLKAKDWMESGHDYKYRFLVRNNLGLLYAKQWMRKEQLDVCRETVNEAVATGNSTYVALALHGVGVAFSGLHQEDSALFYQKNAFRVSKEHYPELLPEIYHHMSRIYLYEEKFRQAEHYVDKLLQVSIDDPAAYITKGHICLKTNRVDSALYYLKKGAASKQLYLQAGACLLIAQAFKARGRLDSVCYYSEVSSCLRDSLDKEMRSSDVIETHQAYWRNQIQEENGALCERNWHVSRRNDVLGVVVFVLIISFVLVCFVREQKRRRLCQMLLEEVNTSRRLIAEQAQRESELRASFYLRLNQLCWPGLGSCSIKLAQEDWKQVLKNTDAVFNRFTVRLRQSYPDMIDSDIRFCCLLKMRLEIRVIADLLGVSKEAIYKRKDRLRKDKMHLLPGEHLDDVLHGFKNV